MNNPARNILLKEIGERLKEIRDEQSQEDFALDLLTIKQTISKYENGKIIPGGEFLYMLYKKRFVNINWLLTGEGNKFNDNRKIAIQKLKKYS